MGCKNSKVTPLKTSTPPPDFRRVSEKRSGRFSHVHEPRHLAQMAEDLSLLDVDESDDDSFCDEAMRRYLGEDEARRDTPNHPRPSVPRVRMIILNKFKFALSYILPNFPRAKYAKINRANETGTN